MQKKHIPHRAVTMETTPLHREKTSSRKTAAIFIVGLLIASLAGYGVNLLMNLPGEHVEGITLNSLEIRETEDTELTITISNDNDQRHSFTVTIEADPIITIRIGNTELTNKNNVYTYSFQADAGDLIIKKFIVHAGSLQPPKTSVTSSLTVKIYIDEEAKAITEQELPITVKK